MEWVIWACIFVVGAIIGFDFAYIALAYSKKSGTLYVEPNAEGSGYFLYLQVTEEVLQRIVRSNHVNLSLKISKREPSRFPIRK